MTPRRLGWLLAVATALVPARAGAAGIYLEAGTLIASIAEALRIEGAELSREAAGAQVLARVAIEERALEVEVRSPSGARILERAVTLDPGLRAAIRVTALLIIEAVRTAAAEVSCRRGARAPRGDRGHRPLGRSGERELRRGSPLRAGARRCRRAVGEARRAYSTQLSQRLGGRAPHTL